MYRTSSGSALSSSVVIAEPGGNIARTAPVWLSFHQWLQGLCILAMPGNPNPCQWLATTKSTETPPVAQPIRPSSDQGR